MEYIKVPKNIVIDYIPDDGILCARCKFCEICPYDYICKSLKRQLDFDFGEGNEE